MDQATFHQELLNLRRQVASITLLNQPHSPSNFWDFDQAHGRFMTSLEELKAYTLSLQSNLRIRWIMSQLQAITPRNKPSSSYMRVCTPIADFRNEDSLPSNQQGWIDDRAQLHAEVESLNHRTCKIEETISHIERNMNNPESVRLTPSIPDMGARHWEISRDQEIAQLEHTLQNTQEDLRNSEEKHTEKDLIIRRLRQQLRCPINGQKV